MLGDSNIVAIVPTHDIGRSRRFYEDTLGLKVVEEFDEGSIGFETSTGSRMLLYTTTVQVPAAHTLASFGTADVEAEVADLESRGVVFEEYDMSEYGFDDMGKSKVLTMPDGMQVAFFKDPEGNILSVAQDRWP